MAVSADARKANQAALETTMEVAAAAAATKAKVAAATVADTAKTKNAKAKEAKKAKATGGSKRGTDTTKQHA
jgi:hypothetical protein